MLILAYSLRDIRFGELMEVCVDSNREKASDWPDLPTGFALQLAEQDYRQYLQQVFFKTPGAVLAIWEEEGIYVSTLRLEPYKDGLLLEGLETAPDSRKKGYAQSLICAVQAHLAARGPVRLYSHVHKKNLASMKAHEKCGFSVISDHAAFIDGSVDHRSVTLFYQA